LTELVKGFIQYPADLKVSTSEPTKRSLIITFQAHASDTGKLIGERGVMIAALREIAQQMAGTLAMRVKVEVSELVTGKKENGGCFHNNPEYKIDKEIRLLESIGKFIFNDSIKVNVYLSENKETTTLVLQMDGEKYDFEFDLNDALDTAYIAIGMAHGKKLSVELDTL
jgi:predicted RNA-binding protein YlqC (UPF0109 family)